MTPTFKMSFSAQTSALLPYESFYPVLCFQIPFTPPLTLSPLPLPLGLTDFASISETCQPLSHLSPLFGTPSYLCLLEGPSSAGWPIQSLMSYQLSLCGMGIIYFLFTCCFLLFAFPQTWAPWDQDLVCFNLSVHLLTDQLTFEIWSLRACVRSAQCHTEELGSWQRSLISQL